MKLAEALLERKTLKTRVDELESRASQNARVQEGDAPSEAPIELLRELNETVAALGILIRKINATNNAATLGSGDTLSDAIVRRDELDWRHEALTSVLNTAMFKQDRYTRSEVRFVLAVDVAALRREADEVAKQRRELDAAIQALNWNTDLRE